MPADSITLQHCDIHLAKLVTRMPFKYGIATMTRVPMAFVRVRAEVNGRAAQGISADLLPPKWFTKIPDKPVEEEVLEMLEVIRQAASFGSGLKAGNPFELWRELYGRQDQWARERKLPPLLAHFGTSLVERALIEAFCRAANKPFHQCLREDQLGLKLGLIHPDIGPLSARDFLPEQPLNQIMARHTVGLSDPLLDEQIPADARLDDGLPQSLEACIRVYGLRHFKLKITGHLDHDQDRLQQIARILRDGAKADFQFTLDGNEQFKALDDFKGYWERLSADPKLSAFLQHLMFVEQPLHRDLALDDAVGRAFAQWPGRPPIIIDESDGSIECLPRALRLGYDGTSHKNCKGVFKGIANRCLLAKLARENPGRPRLMSGEDLANIGPIAVIQDLAVMASLGVESVERNGHHYFAGLSMFSKEIQEQILTCHKGLYQQSAQGWPALRIQEGVLNTETLRTAPFGVGFVMDVESFIPADQFTAAS